MTKSSLAMATSTFFLYGTLKRGHAGHGLIAAQEFLGEARTAPQYRLYDRGRFPCLVEDRVRGISVRGEIWRVADSLIAKLDEWEDVPHLFVRRTIDVPGVPAPVFAYIYHGDVAGMRNCGASWSASRER
jgi:gamma-glutamylcyclotransferase (GGCT)/AIG2-like uncharacterized protein YtfP